MLRRRKRSQREDRRPRPRPQGAAPQPQPQARRRGRPDVPVPADLRVRADPFAPPPKSAPPKSPPTQAARAGDVVLVTGFDPFDGERLNPSWEICARLPAAIAGLRVETVRVPCAFRRSIEVVGEAIERHRPAIVLCLGQAGGRVHLSVERVAINVDDARIADNAGERPVDEPIAANGPPAYFATLPVKAMAAGMRAAGVPAEVSNSAGTYVCNHLMYGVLHLLAATRNPARAGFIHVPYAEEQVVGKPGAPALSLAAMLRGVEAAIEAASRHAQDVKIAEGKEA